MELIKIFLLISLLFAFGFSIIIMLYYLGKIRAIIKLNIKPYQYGLRNPYFDFRPDLLNEEGIKYWRRCQRWFLICIVSGILLFGISELNDGFVEFIKG